MPEDELRARLEARLERATTAAERLLAQITAGPGYAEGDPSAEQDGGAGDSEQPPPSGWQTRGLGSSPADELDRLAQALAPLRELVPPELQRRLGEALRELLLAIRAVIDWYVERLDRRPQGPEEVQDIPIL